MNVISGLEQEIRERIQILFKKEYQEELLKNLKVDYYPDGIISIQPFDIIIKDKFETICISENIYVNKHSYSTNSKVINRIIMDNINKIREDICFDRNSWQNYMMSGLDSGTIDSLKIFSELKK